MGVLVAPVEAQRERLTARAARTLGERGLAVALVSAATLLAVGIAGYHPYAEDGGIYAAAVKRLLDPGLYPYDSAFAMEPSRWSWYAPLVAELVRLTHVPLEWMLLDLHLASVWATLLAAWMLAARCFPRCEARVGAVVLLACWLGLPVAGTALYVMDPYLTARSFATPAMLLALAGALDSTGEGRARRVRGCMLWMVGIATCAAMHPLTAMYAAFATAMLACMRARSRAARVWGAVGLCAAVVIAAACVQRFAPAESASYVRAALTRSYWFLGEWRWYEVVGLFAPLGILGGVGWLEAQGRLGATFRLQISAPQCGASGPLKAGDALARMAVMIGVTVCVLALLFAREISPTHLVARLQPLRVFQIVYVVMIVVLARWLGERVLQSSAWRWAAAVALLGGVMFYAARTEYLSSSHLEFPCMKTQNAWVQAFLWVRTNTPKDALFAMDADYVHASGEDAQGFRALAERSVLPDRSKDGGEASIASDLAAAWAEGVAAQDGLNAISDAERAARLRPLGVTWMVLGVNARTEFECPYVNSSVRVCRLR